MSFFNFTVNLSRIFVFYFLFDYFQEHFYFQFGILLSSVLCDILVNWNINLYLFFILFLILGVFNCFETKNPECLVIVFYNLLLMFNYSYLKILERRNEYHKSLFTYLNELEDCSDENYECFICLENYKEKPNLKILCCSHVFHPECLLTWIQKNKDTSCPVCKKDILDCNEIIVV